MRRHVASLAVLADRTIRRRRDNNPGGETQPEQPNDRGGFSDGPDMTKANVVFVER